MNISCPHSYNKNMQVEDFNQSKVPQLIMMFLQLILKIKIPKTKK